MGKYRESLRILYVYLILVLSVERIGRRIGIFGWGLQPKRGQHIGGIFERGSTRLLSRRRRVLEASPVLIPWSLDGYKF